MSSESVWDRSLRRRLSRRRAIQGGVGLGALTLAACTSSPASPTAAPAATGAAGPSPTAARSGAAPATAGPRPKYGGTLRSSVISSGTSDDYQMQTGAQLGLNTSMAYSGLLKFKHGPAIKPGTYISEGDLAESWEQPDDLTYIFKLRRGVKFQNLKPVNGREATSAD